MNQLRKQLVDNPYAWPGGYPIFAITEDNSALCKDCCKAEATIIDAATDDIAEDNQWRIIALDINWEDNNLYCDHCSKQIEVAYED